MAKAKYGSEPTAVNKVKRKGVHAKSKASKHKGAKNYLKKYRGQGK
jgi:hypothetical protein|tara:strand:- start:66 stop:203 length:138 start_codon:yes stop_codon:yes gene_type:complete